MSVNIPARAIVVQERMRHFERKLFGNSYDIRIVFHIVQKPDFAPKVCRGMIHDYDGYHLFSRCAQAYSDSHHQFKRFLTAVILEIDENGQIRALQNPMDKRIVPELSAPIRKFLAEQGELTLCVAAAGVPYCASCFYSFMPDAISMVIKSEEKTRHIREALEYKSIAGTVTERNRLPGIIKGIQFSGIFLNPSEDLLLEAKEVYYKRYPFASVMQGKLWVIEAHWIKMTDNTPFTGRKQIWSRS